MPFLKLQMPDEEQFFKHPFKSPFCPDNMEMICVKLKLVEFDSNKLNENIDMLAVVIALILEIVELELVAIVLVLVQEVAALEEAIVVVISIILEILLLVTRVEVSLGMLVEISVDVETTVVDIVELAHLSSGIRFVWFDINKLTIILENKTKIYPNLYLKIFYF